MSIKMKHRKTRNEELDRKTISEFKTAAKIPVVIILDNIRSAHNIGSVFRTADAFLIQKIYLCGICAKPPDKNIRKTALGATETVSWEYAEDTLEVVDKLKNKGFEILSVEQADGATYLQDFRPEQEKTYAVVFGNEVKGVQQEVVSQSDVVLEIPQKGSKHSFNISVSMGIVCWELSSKLSLFGSEDSNIINTTI